MANSRADRRALASCVLGHQVKRPWESRLVHSQKPCPSYTSSLSAVLARFRKTKTAPLRGCSRSFWRHTAAKLSIPFRKSTGSVASKIRLCGESCSISRSPKRSAPAPPVGTEARGSECAGGHHQLAGGRLRWLRWVVTRREVG